MLSYVCTQCRTIVLLHTERLCRNNRRTLCYYSCLISDVSQVGKLTSCSERIESMTTRTPYIQHATLVNRNQYIQQATLVPTRTSNTVSPRTQSTNRTSFRLDHNITRQPTTNHTYKQQNHAQKQQNAVKHSNRFFDSLVSEQTNSLNNIQYYGAALLCTILLVFCTAIYTIMCSPVYSAVSNTQYQSQTYLIYINAIPFVLLATYFNWLGLSLFRHN